MNISKTPKDIRRAVSGYFGLCSFMDEQAGKVLDALEATGLTGTRASSIRSHHGDAVGKRGLWEKSTLYEETAQRPSLLARPSARPRDRYPVQPIDTYPFIMACVGEGDPAMVEPDHPGVSVARLANGERPNRTVLTEYHGMGSTRPSFCGAARPIPEVEPVTSAVFPFKSMFMGRIFADLGAR